MSQPLDRTCKIAPLGKIDEAAGEFWTNPFDMPKQGDNLSAYERNRVFLNAGDAGFVDASFSSGADIDSDSRSVMVADFDGDLAPDLLVGSVGGGPLRLFINQIRTWQAAGDVDSSPSPAPADADSPAAPEPAMIPHRVVLRLRGVASNAQGIGARVTIETAEGRMIRDLFPPNGFMGQSPARLYVGLGQASRIDRLTVDWPTGQQQRFDNLPADVELTLTEGDPTPHVHDGEPPPASQ